MKTKSEGVMHTPGPWAANLHHTQEVGGRTYGFVSANGVVPVAGVVLGVEGMSQDEGRANAVLIAAAPKMLAALTTIANLLRTDLETHLGKKIGQQVRTAIADATAPSPSEIK